MTPLPSPAFFTNSRGDTFTQGEWVIAEYGIYQLGEVREYDWGIAVDRRDGYVNVGGRADDCWKLTLTTKVVADGVKAYREQLSALPGEHSFNWPDLHDKLVEWAEVGYALDRGMPDKDDYDYRQQRADAFKARLWTPLEVWFQEVKTIAENATRQTAGGVRVIGRR